MKKNCVFTISVLIFLLLSLMGIGSITADDTCIFGVGAGDVPPNIVFLQDNGADMEYAVWHSQYDDLTVFTPELGSYLQWDVVDLAAGPPGEIPIGPTVLVLGSVDESYPFAVGAEAEEFFGGEVTTSAIVIEKIYVGTKLHLVLDTETITPDMKTSFVVGRTVRRYKNKTNIATGIIEEIIRPVFPEPCVPPACLAPAHPNGFFNEKGYGIVGHGGEWYLVKVKDDLTLDPYDHGLKATSGNTWTVDVWIDTDGNGKPDHTDGSNNKVSDPDPWAEPDATDYYTKTITLPALPSSAVEPVTDPAITNKLGAFNIKDNAAHFRYSANYLNWIFGFKPYVTPNTGTSFFSPGTLPTRSRFYYAKLAIMAAGKFAENNANFGVYDFVATNEGASSVQPLKQVVQTPLAADPKNNILDSAFVNNVNNMGTVDYSPLAEGLATIGGYYNSPSSGILEEQWCQDQFVIVVSPGVSSMDRTDASQYVPTALQDYDNDGANEGKLTLTGKDDFTITFDIPTNFNGSSWLDDVAYYLKHNDIVGYITGTQNVSTYTVGYMTKNTGSGRSWQANAFLKNVSNNGNGLTNLYDLTNKDYGKYHYTAENPNDLADAIIAAVQDIISRTSTFTSPVVPITRTVSGDWVYLALFKPLVGNFWEGDVVKYRLNYLANGDVDIVGADGNPVYYDNGALREDAVPYWSTKRWADGDFDPSLGDECLAYTGTPCNYIHNSARNLYTYLGATTDLTDSQNAFSTGNLDDPSTPLVVEGLLNSTTLGNPTTGLDTLIQYIRGADSLNTDLTKINDNREVITGDILHSKPLVVQYKNASTIQTYLFYGANDGMLHAVHDSEGPLTGTYLSVIHLGTESWAFIPPDQLHRLKLLLEGTGHPYFVDASPKVYMRDLNGDGLIEALAGDTAILVFGLRKGGTSYYALNVTDPENPVLSWWISQMTAANAAALGIPAPTYTISELGETWSEPEFAVVKTTDLVDDPATPVFEGDAGTEVVIFGGGYSADNSKGRGVFARNILTGAPVWQYTIVENASMQYSIPSEVRLVTGSLKSEVNASRTFLDKFYVGDTGGQMWRFGKFTDLTFPDANLNMNSPWTGERIFRTGTATQKFFYPPSVVRLYDYHLVYMMTGNREDPCNQTTSDAVYVVKDNHAISTPLTLSDLVNTSGLTCPYSGTIDKGWYLSLGLGEKVLAESSVFGGAFYFTTFTPNDDPCLPGGLARLYAVDYQDGCPLTDWGSGAHTRGADIGGGIPSEPVFIVTEKTVRIIISVSSTEPDPEGGEGGAGFGNPYAVGPPQSPTFPPVLPIKLFHYLWWLEKIN